jgi:hypothetical protein
LRLPTAAVLTLFVATAAVAIADEAFVVAGAANYTTIWAALNDAVTGAEAPVFGAVGVLIVVRRGSAIGWLLSAMGLAVASMSAASSYATALSPTANAALAAEPIWLAPWWSWVGSIAWLLAVALLFVFMQVFPDGRPLSPRWRLPLVLAFVWPLWFLAVAVLSPVTLQNGRDIPNPNGLNGPLGDVMLALKVALVPLTAAIGLAAVGSVLLRYRRSTGSQRAQLKWFAYGAAVVAGTVTLSGWIVPHDASNVVNGLAISVLPLAVAAAILRQGLYDIDLVIERTLVYGVTTAAIAAAFFGGIVVLQTLFRPFTGGSEIAVAGSTLASFALFQPLRRRIQRAVDRRFYRARYDAERTLDDFSVRLRDEVDLDAVGAELVDAAQRTVLPAHASVWLRETPR